MPRKPRSGVTNRSDADERETRGSDTRGSVTMRSDERETRRTDESVTWLDLDESVTRLKIEEGVRMDPRPYTRQRGS